MFHLKKKNSPKTSQVVVKTGSGVGPYASKSHFCPLLASRPWAGDYSLGVGFLLWVNSRSCLAPGQLEAGGELRTVPAGREAQER